VACAVKAPSHLPQMQTTEQSQIVPQHIRRPPFCSHFGLCHSHSGLKRQSITNVCPPVNWMESRFIMGSCVPIIRPAVWTDKGTPVKLKVFVPPPPGLEQYQRAGWLSDGENTNGVLIGACTHGSHSTCCSNSNILEAVEEEHEAHKYSRPCRAKRNRHKKLVYRFEIEILAHPESFDFEALTSRLPQRLQSNHLDRQRLNQRLYDFKHQVASCSP